MTRGLYFAFILLLAGYSYAQQSCSQRLNRAEDLYNSGRLLEIPALIQSCLDDDKNFTVGEKIRARKLLTKVHIFTDNEPAAESELIELLQVDPVHELQSEDPSELKVLMRKFRTWPIYRLEGKIGGNLAVTDVDQKFSTSSRDWHKTYGPAISFQVEVNITRHWKKGIEFGSGAQLRATNYTVLFNPDSEVETEIKNSQVMLRFPLFVRYNLNYDSKNSGFIPYVFMGGSFDLLLNGTYSEASRNGGTAFSIKSNDANLLKNGQVNKVNYSALGGVGVKIKSKKGNFGFVEARYDMGLNLYNVPEERFLSLVSHGDLQYIEDDVFLNFVSINVGYIYSIFKPEKLVK